MAAEFAKEGFLALAVDLYDGKVASSPADAESYMNGVDAAQAEETLASWIGWLRADSRGNGRVGTVGWCFGGGWSLINRNKTPRHTLAGSIPAGGTVVVTMPAEVPLSNQGGIITLLDKNGLKVHGVSYTKEDASSEGWTIVF